MQGGTLLITRAIKLHVQRKKRLEELGFYNVEVTAEERDSLNMVINDLKPRLVLINSFFYQAATPLMMGQLLKLFPKLNITAVSLAEFPDSLAAWFIWHGVKSYVNLWEGFEEFHHGFEKVRKGEKYIAPHVQHLIDNFHEWPETNGKATKRLMEILIFLCNGFSADSIGEELQLTRKTVYNHMERLYNAFNVKNRDEMVAKAWQLHLVSDKDMCFLDHRQETKPLPEWAVVKQETNKRVLRYVNQN
jgi:DNA-binding NarL/FixJ family response regulator